MEFEQFKSIIDQYPLKILYDSSCAKEYQYVNSDICRFLIVKFSKLPNFIEVPYGFRYSKRKKHIVPIDRKHKAVSTFLDYKHITNPSEKVVHKELSRIIKNLKKSQFNLKLENIQKDF